MSHVPNDSSPTSENIEAGGDATQPATPIGIIQTGTANLASVLAGLRRAGAAPFFVETPEQLLTLPKVLLPGVGAFGAAMQRLHNAGMVKALQQRLREDRPTLGICLGLQLLCRYSEESHGVEGLGLIDATVKRFDSALRVPQFGWSQVTPTAAASFFPPGYAYFANSYCLAAETAERAGWKVATAEYGGSYVAAMRKGQIVACQFHPELSGPWGEDLLRRWCQSTTTEEA